MSVLSHRRSFLDGADWEAAFTSFFRRNSSIFADFDEQRGFDLSMTEVHNTFLTTLDALIDKQLARIDLPIDKCASLILTDSSSQGSAALHAVRSKLQRYMDFIAFGKMMRSRHESLESSRAADVLEGGQQIETRAPPLERSLEVEGEHGGKHAGSVRARYTRVLWDIENVQIPSGVDALDVSHMRDQCMR